MFTRMQQQSGQLILQKKTKVFQVPCEHTVKCLSNMLDERDLQVSNGKKSLKCLLAKRKENEIAWPFKT